MVSFCNKVQNTYSRDHFGGTAALKGMDDILGAMGTASEFVDVEDLKHFLTSYSFPVPDSHPQGTSSEFFDVEDLKNFLTSFYFPFPDSQPLGTASEFVDVGDLQHSTITYSPSSTATQASEFVDVEDLNIS